MPIGYNRRNAKSVLPIFISSLSLSDYKKMIQKRHLIKVPFSFAELFAKRLVKPAC